MLGSYYPRDKSISFLVDISKANVFKPCFTPSLVPSKASDLACWVMKCWSSVMRLFTGRACFTWIKPSVWLDKYQLGPARSQSNLLCSGNGSQIPAEWMKRKSASGSLPRDRSERRGWKSCGPSSAMDPGQGSLGETDGIIIHILSVLFISSTVSCFSSSCWEKWRDPYFWGGQITLSPLGDAAAFNIVYVCPCVRFCVF